MTATVVAQTPQMDFAVGSYELVSDILPLNAAGYVVEVTKGSWPSSGNVLTLSIDRSDDSGVTWRDDSSITVSGVTLLDESGQPTNTGKWHVSLPQDGCTTRKLRATIDVLQACNAGGTLSAV